MIYLFRLLLVWGLVAPSLALGHTQWLLTHHNVARVYDGDTIYVNIPGLPPVFGEDLGIRFHGVDTPEMRSRCKTDVAKDREKAFAVVVRDKLRQKIMSGQYLLIHNLQRGSFFRVVADLEVDGESLNQWLLDNHYAYAVIDEKMRPNYWCDANNY